MRRRTRRPSSRPLWISSGKFLALILTSVLVIVILSVASGSNNTSTSAYTVQSQQSVQPAQVHRPLLAAVTFTWLKPADGTSQASQAIAPPAAGTCQSLSSAPEGDFSTKVDVTNILVTASIRVYDNSNCTGGFRVVSPGQIDTITGVSVRAFDTGA